MGHRQRTARRFSAAAANALIAEASAPEQFAEEVLDGMAARTAGIQLQPRRKRGRPRKTDLHAPVKNVWAQSLKAASAAKRKCEQQPRARSVGPGMGACVRLAGGVAANCLEGAGLEGFTAGSLLNLKSHAGPAYSLEPLSSPGSPGNAPDEAMLADFLSGNLASPEDAPAVPCALLQARASAGSQAPPWAFDADAQAMLPLESMLDMLGQQPKPGAEDSPKQLQSSCSEACITATSSATEVCLEAAAPWPSQELEAGAVRDGHALLPPSSPLGDAAPFARQGVGGGMADGPMQSVSTRAFHGLELRDAVGPAPGDARGPPARRAAWGSALELAGCDTRRTSLAHRSAPQLGMLSESPRSGPASSRGPAQRPHSLLAARALAQQLLRECGRPSPGSVLHQDCERLAAVAAAAAAVAPTSSVVRKADDDDLPAEAKPLEGLAWRGSEACLLALQQCSPKSLPPPGSPWEHNTLAHALHFAPGGASAQQGPVSVLECLGSAPLAQSGAGPAAPHSPRGPEAALRLSVLGELGRTLSRAQSKGDLSLGRSTPGSWALREGPFSAAAGATEAPERPAWLVEAGERMSQGMWLSGRATAALSGASV